MIKEGKDTTEHERAWRVEGVGLFLVAVGVAVILSGVLAWQGIALVALGAYLIERGNAAYQAGRKDVKAAAARPAPVHASPRI